ncbi:MAG TPA: hypothetical protein VEW69_11485, partial [Alphaproteobacteria bacterium]|nr:hypothetical protein [Alphaproteobacteria bacterium]
MTRRKTAATAKAIMIALGLLVFTPFTHAQSGDAGTPPSLVEVYWKSSKTIVSPGITDVVVLDPEVTRAEAGADTIQFFGLQRGETVAMGYVNGAPVSMRIRVIERPPAFVAPSLLRRRSEMAQGIVATSVQTSSTGGATSTTLLNSFNWTQSVGSDGRFTFNSQAEENGLANGRQFNLRRAEAVYQSPTFDLHAIDFSTNLASGGLQHHLN